MNRMTSQTGSSLIEILVALLIFVFVVLSSGQATLGGRRATTVERHVVAATTLARDGIEQLRTLPGTAATLVAGTHNDPLNPLHADGTAGGSYTRSWEIADGVPQSGLKRVRMMVRWSTPSGSRTVTLASYLNPS